MGGGFHSKGSIPAWAGETRQENAPELGNRVYPRVGGGNETGYLRIDDTDGLSPRGRGKPDKMRTGMWINRSIPAWAGET